ncbi:hypothetical protein GDO86_011898 [Hymenochirus boettgeri]|uniref:Uncharacterized protein n=1 Tax=Hymenochirus boettgeri TaxID=247094 RepID=A0A8T2JIC7_9PIPI|nr:hypothetical protein GDO86_011898 [Hymenochirus boettgeri]
MMITCIATITLARGIELCSQFKQCTRQKVHWKFQLKIAEKYNVEGTARPHPKVRLGLQWAVCLGNGNMCVPVVVSGGLIRAVSSMSGSFCIFNVTLNENY